MEEQKKLDYSLESPEDRNQLVQEIIAATPPEKLTNRYLTILADYLIFAMDREDKKKKEVVTENRALTIKKRELSFQGLSEQFENGEDNIYNMIANDKNIIFMPRFSITPQDLKNIPELKSLRDEIERLEAAVSKARGRQKYLLKKQIIEMRQDQYIIKSAYIKPMYCMNGTRSLSQVVLDNEITVTPQGKIVDRGVFSFFNPSHISLLLKYYTVLKQDAYDKLWCDSYYLLLDLENLIDSALKEQYPIYYDLLIYKIDGKPNIEIQGLLQAKYNKTYAVEYISALWKNKIPKLLADKAESDFLIWYYTTQEEGAWKQCGCCGEIKLAHSKFYTRNHASKDGFYSICKECRKIKYKAKKEENGCQQTKKCAKNAEES